MLLPPGALEVLRLDVRLDVANLDALPVGFLETQ